MPQIVPPRLLARLAACVLACLWAGGIGHTEPARPVAASLGDFFKLGPVLQDRNSDGVVDFVDARVVLPAQASSADAAAAATVAARLGFETTAMNLPVAVIRAPETTSEPSLTPTVYIGTGALAGAPLTLDQATIGALKPGEGLAAAFMVGSTPQLVLAGDTAGVNAAAVQAAGLLPNLGDPKGPTVDKVADEVREFLAARGVKPAAVLATALVTHGTGDALDRLIVEAQFAAPGDVVKAEVALNQFKATSLQAAKRALSWPSIASVRFRLRAGPTFSFVDLPRATPAVAAAATPPPPRRPGAGARENLDLSSVFANDGALADSDNNLIPDRVDVLLSAEGDGTEGVISLAARLGLESTGVSLPIAKPAKALGAPDAEPTLVLIGRMHPLLETLEKAHKWTRPALSAGDGLIQIVRKAFGEKSSIVVTGGDPAGTARATAQLAEHFPHIWSRGKDRPTLDDVEDEVRRFLGGRTPAGQAAMALYKLDRIGTQLADRTLTSADVSVFVDKADPGLDAVISQAAKSALHAGTTTVHVQNMDVQHGRTIVSEDLEIASEVDEFWKAFRARVLPVARKRAAVRLEARLSEPAEVRRHIEEQVRAELARAGADEKASEVRVLSAYKQGYSWIDEVIRPQLVGKPVSRITIRFAEVGPPADWAQQGMYAPTRWLLELYPIDEILAQGLKLPSSQIVFEKAAVGAPAYDVEATDAAGHSLLRQTFEPRVVERPFFDRFPDYERVRVTTGWVRAEVAGRVVVDERIETDPERFWDHFQAKTLPALYDHVMALGNGKPRAEDAPFFGEMTVDLTLSEPEVRLPVDQEQISSMEALHEEIYFNTLHFFDVMGRFTRGAPLAYPGRIIPVVHPKADGKAGRARITITGFDSPRPAVVVKYVDKAGKSGQVRLDIPRIAVDRPQALAAHVHDGRPGLDRLDLRVKVDTEKDEREALVARAADDRVDRTMLSAEQVVAVVGHLGRLRDAGCYADALAWPDLRGLQVTVGWEHESRPATERTASLAAGSPKALPDIRTLLPAGYRYKDGERLVQWDEPIAPGEAAGILARMSTFPEAHVYKAGESYLGKDIWAMDLIPPVEASHWSQAKATTMKPTVVYSARQHANEVSSTSHTLALAELLLTDPAWRVKLKKVNVVFHPITNADGAQLAFDLQKITPTHMLHAGYLGPLGVDVTAAQWENDPIYPESGIRAKLWRTWLPDVFLNPHGYPTHEWVQLFSEYAAWVRTRAVETRDYWTMRGWWMPGFAWLDDPKYPRHAAEQMKLLDRITEYAKAAPGTVALNDRAYRRYQKYSFDFDQKNFKLDFTNGVLIYKALKGARANPQAQDFMSRQPNVTIWDGSTEAPDETAHGDWLTLVATAGLQWDKAVLDYLVSGRHEVERKVEPFWGGVSLTVNRPRPPKPPKTDDARATPDGPGASYED